VTLPYLTSELAGTGGTLRARDDDFVVDEELPYAPSGTGDHVFVRIEKRGMTTPEAVRVIARTLGIRERDIGVAGMKDRRAVARQWLSLPPRSVAGPEAAVALALSGSGVAGPPSPEATGATGAAEAAGAADAGCPLRVLEAHRHPHKLRTGHVRSNRFALRVRGVDGDAVARAQAILAALAAPPGAPNWYGEQRFGRDGGNAARGKALIAAAAQGGARTGGNPRLDRLMVSALQSQLFNDWLIARLADGLYRTAITGDLLHKRSGGMFECDDPETDTARLAAGELVITGPMFGDRMRAPPDGSHAAEREAAVLARHGLDRNSFAGVRAIAEGTRRDATIALGDPAVTAVDGTTIELGFTLPGGGYATVVMREIMKDPAQRVDGDPEAA
jgi:tRNA pseudouridine13 synthase